MSEFNNKNSCNTMSVELDNGVELYYHLYDNPVQTMWQYMVKQGTEIDSMFRNKDINFYLSELKQLSKTLNFKINDDLPSQYDLNEIHADFESNPLCWYMPNHLVKKKWNKEILSAVNYVKNIKFFDSDMYINSLLEHTQYV